MDINCGVVIKRRGSGRICGLWKTFYGTLRAIRAPNVRRAHFAHRIYVGVLRCK